MTNTTDDYDDRTLVERTDTGLSITTKIKRGTDTRDQDEHTIKAKGHTALEAIETHRQGLEHVERELDRVRHIQASDEVTDGE